RVQVEDVLQALAVGLDQDGEGGMAARHLEQVVAALPLLPQWRALAGTAARQEQRAGRVLSKARGEQRRSLYLGGHGLPDGIRIQREKGRIRWPVRLGQAQREPVVGVDGLSFDAQLALTSGLYRQRPGCVHPRAEGCEHAD